MFDILIAIIALFAILIALIDLVLVIYIGNIFLNISSKNNEEVFTETSVELAKIFKIWQKNHIKRNMKKPEDNSSQDGA
ncbi:MAG: hypothetical protein FWG87_02245 [Defluviitaleaceae bacterium]|nr:hypothetical protein [Defluviitaleaceae bacterium]